MSGKPSPAGVRETIDILDAIAACDEQIAELRPKVEQLKAVEESRAKYCESLGALLDRMDISEPGNFGHPGRLAWFLAEMRRRVREVSP